MKNRGFTLLELILVMAILAVLIGMTIFRYGIVEEYRAKHELKKLIRMIELTKKDAVVNHFRSHMEIDFDGYYINWKNRKWKETFSSALQLKRKNITIVSFNESGKISGKEFSQNSAGRMVFQIRDNYYTITISPVTGRVTCYKGLHNEKEKGISID